MEYSISEYAKKQKVTPKTVYEWIKEGKLIYRLTPSKRKIITGEKE